MKNVLILGDSTSMTVGFEEKSYPFLLAKEEVWPDDLRFLNSSQPGITAADAVAYYFRRVRCYYDISAVIICLGNCDANGTELRKGKFTPIRQLRHQIRDTLGMKPPKAKMFNRLFRFEWNTEHYNSSLERPEPVQDFRYNIVRIINHCRKNRIPVILVRPTAHFNFPSGIGKGNFIYYHQADFNYEIVDELAFPDDRFLEAFRGFELADYENSRINYKRILESLDDQSPRSKEYPVLVTHNYALACMRLGRLTEAEVLFQGLLEERNARLDIFRYNYAQLRKLCGDPDGYAENMQLAYSIDTSMYRVKKGYVETIEDIASEFTDSVHLVDITDVSDDLFVDHCHLLPEGQLIIKERIADVLRELKLSNGSSPSIVVNDLLNPEISLGNSKEFNDYYRTYADCTAEQVSGDMKRLEEDYRQNKRLTEYSLQFVSPEMARAITYFRRHPCFSHPVDILRHPPICLSDLGRFPECFVIRRVAAYLGSVEADSSYSQLIPKSLGLVKTSDELLRVLPSARRIGNNGQLMPPDPEVNAEWMDRIIAESLRVLTAHLRQGPQIRERLMTTIYWFFRETLRWGAHSRHSMRYDRLTLEYLAESLTIAGWLDHHGSGTRASEIHSLTAILIDTIEVHERFVRQYSPSADNCALLEEYRKALESLLNDRRLGVNVRSTHFKSG